MEQHHCRHLVQRACRNRQHSRRLAIASGLPFARKIIYPMLLAPFAIPWIVYRLAMVFFWGALNLDLWLWTVFAAHTIIAIPYVLRVTLAVLVGMPPALLKAARSAGANPCATAGTEQSQELALVQGEGDVVDDRLIAIALEDVAQFEIGDVHAHEVRTPSPRRRVTARMSSITTTWITEAVATTGSKLLTMEEFLKWAADMPQIVSVAFNPTDQAKIVTPIYWSVKMTGDRAAFVDWNPFFHLIELVRAPLLGEAPRSLSWGVAAVMAAIGLPLSLDLYRRSRAKLPYWVS